MGVNQTAEHLRTRWHRALVNNSTDADFSSITPTTTAPATVDESGDPSANRFVGDCGLNGVQLMFFGQDTENDQHTARVTLWRRAVSPASVAAGSKSVDLWVPYVVGQFELTLSATVGVSGAVVADDEFFVDTITEVGTTWDDNLVTTISPTGDLPALVRINTIGFEKFMVDFDINLAGGTDGTAVNCLYSFGA